MHKYRIQLFLLLLITLAAASCSAPKKVTYLVDADNLPQQALAQKQAIVDPTLSPGDLLNIRVYYSDMAAVAPFNKGAYVTPEGNLQGFSGNNQNNISQGSEANTEYYLINAQGNIDFPTLGEIHAAGLTKQELAETIANDIYPKYIKDKPTVEVRLMNFKVTVLGQVKSPGQYTSYNERMNILEAIARAGDLDIKGDRQNVLLYRTNPDGTREVHRLNLQDSNLLLSPYFNLQQNDFIYIEPNASAKQNAWQMHQGWSAAISIVGGISSLAGLVIGIVNLTN